jgi:transmembrane sensor
VDEETQRLESASDWLICLQRDDVAVEEIVSWVQWCEVDPRNRRAFERLLPLWQALDRESLSPDRANLLALLSPEALTQLREQLKSSSSTQSATSAPATDSVRPGVRWRVWTPVGVAAVVLLMLGVFGSGLLDAMRPLDSITKLNSAVAVNRAATLPDGSSLALGAQSVVAIDFKGARRTVELNEGEAFFAVKHDKTRPFVVRAGSLSVTAIGTQFDVLRTGSRVAVTVKEGLVQVATNPTTNAPGWSLLAPAGHQVVYDAAQHVGPTLRVVDPAATTAWQQGRLEYIEEPLASVIANLNRYSSRHIMVRDADLARLAYTGTIEVQSIDEWLRALPLIFPLRVASGDDGQVVIERRSQSFSR